MPQQNYHDMYQVVAKMDHSLIGPWEIWMKV